MEGETESKGYWERGYMGARGQWERGIGAWVQGSMESYEGRVLQWL